MSEPRDLTDQQRVYLARCLRLAGRVESGEFLPEFGNFYDETPVSEQLVEGARGVIGAWLLEADRRKQGTRSLALSVLLACLDGAPDDDRRLLLVFDITPPACRFGLFGTKTPEYFTWWVGLGSWPETSYMVGGRWRMFLPKRAVDQCASAVDSLLVDASRLPKDISRMIVETLSIQDLCASVLALFCDHDGCVHN